MELVAEQQVTTPRQFLLLCGLGPVTAVLVPLDTLMSTTILLADDDADNRAIYGVILRHYGYRVLDAVNGDEAVQIARECQPDLIVMDIVMPLLDGLAATRLLKSDSLTEAIPVVMLTAHLVPSEQDEALAAGCDGFLLKPVEPKRVVEEVRRVLGMRSAHATGSSP
jgi:two-component system, cell cycle response regulator DivK